MRRLAGACGALSGCRGFGLFIAGRPTPNRLPPMVIFNITSPDGPELSAKHASRIG